MDSVLNCLVSDSLAPGPFAAKLLEVAQDRFGSDAASLLRSSAYALELALRCLAPEPGSGVVLSALAPAYQVDVIEAMGLRALYADVDPDSGSITPETVREARKAGPAAVLIATGTMGVLPPMEALLEEGLPVIEDISRCPGASLGEGKAGSFGAFALLGLESADFLTAGGGAILMAAERRNATVLRNRTVELREEFLMGDMNAALGFIQVKELETGVARRKELAQAYSQALAMTRHKTLLQAGEGEQVHYSFPLVLASGLKDARAYAKKKEVDTQVAFEDAAFLLRPREGFELKEARSLSMRCLLFPLHPGVKGKEAAKVARVIQTLP